GWTVTSVMVTDEMRGNERINGDRGRSDIEGKAAREAASKCGQRASFNGVHGNGRHGREHGVLGTRRVDGKAKWLSERERTNQARRVSDFTRSRNDSRGPNILTVGNVRQPCRDQGSV